MINTISVFAKRLAGLALSAGCLGSAATAEPAMWTLSDEDTVISIIGTVHVLPEGIDWRSERIDAAFDAADQVCFELDVVGRALEVFGLTYKLGTFEGGDKLTNHLDEEQEADLRRTADALGIPFASLNVMKPWFASLTIEQYVVDRMGLAEGVEMLLYPEVTEQGKEICEMETAREQLGALSGLPFEDQLESLFYEPEEIAGLDIDAALAYGEAELSGLIDDWLAGDVEAIGEAASPEGFGSEAFYNALLVQRNANWIPKIEALLETDGNVFVAVGAAHLAGEDSVIAMLRAQGYAVEGP